MRVINVEPDQAPGLNNVFFSFINFISNSKKAEKESKKERIPLYAKYNRNVNQRLQEINENLSTILTETFRDIDNICDKVRSCMEDMKYQESQRNIILNETLPLDTSSACPAENNLEDFNFYEIEELNPLESLSLQMLPKKLEFKNNITNSENKCMPDFATFINGKAKTALLKRKRSKHKKQLIKEFRSFVASREYDKRSIDNIINKISEKIDKFSETTDNENKIVKAKKQQTGVQVTNSLLKTQQNASTINLDAEVYRRPGTTNLKKKLVYQLEANDSYLYFQKTMGKNLKSLQNKSSTSTTCNQLKKKYKDSLWFSQKNHKKTSIKKLSRCNVSTASLRSSKSLKSEIKLKEKTSNVKRLDSAVQKKNKMKSYSSGQFNLAVYNQVPNVVEKCRNNWIRLRNRQAPHRKLECVDILDNLTAKDLMPLKSEYPKKDRTSDLKDYLQILTEEGTEKIWKELLQPNVERSKRILRTRTNNLDEIKINETENEAINETKNEAKSEPSQKFSNQSLSKRDVIHKLRPLIFDTDQFKAKDVTVLPVQVFYENVPKHLDNKPATYNQKCSIVAMKEDSKPIRAKWGVDGRKKSPERKPKYVKKEKEISSDSKDSNKLPTRFIAKLKNSDVNKFKQSNSSQMTTKRVSFSANTLHLENKPKPLRFDKKLASEIENKFYQISPKERKMWEHKYAKSVGSQLVNFVENSRGELSFTKLPQYSKPKSSVTEEVGLSDLKLNSSRHKQMLQHLKKLKNKNYAIQQNIEKAIIVIEAKLTGILTSPGSNESVEAFDAMEKEITSVLDLIKCKEGFGRTGGKSSANKINTEEDFEKISQELFMRLERILESEGSQCITADSSLNEIKSNSIKMKAETEGVQDSICPPTKDIEETNINNNVVSTDIENTENQTTIEEIEEQSNIQENELPQRNDTECEDKPREDNSVNTYLNATGDFQRPLSKEETQKDNTSEKSSELSTTSDYEETTATINTEIVESCIESNVAPVDPPRFVEIISDDSANHFPEHISEIIEKVEDIYKELDEIQLTNTPSLIPVFQEKKEVFDVNSEEFLTPFMQAVKDKRKNITSNVIRSASYYNVLNFLESLNDIHNDDHVVEIHTARLCHFPLELRDSQVFSQCYTIHSVTYLESERPSCMKKKNPEGKMKCKKVTFCVMAENKNIQTETFEECEDISKKFEEKLCSTEINNELDFQKDCFFESQTTEKCTTENNNELNSQNDGFFESQTTENSNELDCQKDYFFDEDLTTDEGGGEKNNENNLVCQTDSQFQEEMPSRDLNMKKQYFLETDAHLKIFYEDAKDIPRVVIKHKVCKNDRMLKEEDYINTGISPNIVVFREISEVSDLLKPLRQLEDLNKLQSDFNKIQIIKKVKKTISNGICEKLETNDEKNVTFLKTVYAMVYIFIFTALNFEYVCV